MLRTMFVAATWRSSAGTLPGPASCRGRGGGRPPGTAQSGTGPLSPEHFNSTRFWKLRELSVEALVSTYITVLWGLTLSRKLQFWIWIIEDSLRLILWCRCDSNMESHWINWINMICPRYSTKTSSTWSWDEWQDRAQSEFKIPSHLGDFVPVIF